MEISLPFHSFRYKCRRYLHLSASVSWSKWEEPRWKILFNKKDIGFELGKYSVSFQFNAELD